LWSNLPGMDDLSTRLLAFARDQRGATAIEYGLVGLLVSVSIITAATQLGQAIVPFFEFVAAKVASVVL
jgi:pilus assembly protein Flp/PilA